MNLGYLMLVIAAVISVGTSLSVHRYLGLGTMAAGGAVVNYFFMEPVHSFRISQIGDIAALGCYGVVGMIVVLSQTTAVRPGTALRLARFQLHARSIDESTPLLDGYHFDLLVQLCAEISRMRGASVDLRDVLNVALRRLGEDSESASGEILDDVQRQLEYEEWIASQLAKGQSEVKERDDDSRPTSK